MSKNSARTNYEVFVSLRDVENNGLSLALRKSRDHTKKGSLILLRNCGERLLSGLQLVSVISYSSRQCEVSHIYLCNE
jgi:hypothetical protein